jgi:UrcA family protein
MLALAPAAVLAFLWPAASAQTPAKTAFVEVSIEHVRGQETGSLSDMQKQIEAASRSVCAKVAIRSPLVPREQADCQRQAVASAMEQLVEADKGIAVARAD